MPAIEAFDAETKALLEALALPRVWTRERRNLLRKLWLEGVPSTEIARQIGVTKNAVIGQARRMRLPPLRACRKRHVAQSDIDSIRRF